MAAWIEGILEIVYNHFCANKVVQKPIRARFLYFVSEKREAVLVYGNTPPLYSFLARFCANMPVSYF